MSKTVGEIIVKTLSMLGTKVIFGILGVHSVELYRGIARENILYVTPRHEQGGPGLWLMAMLGKLECLVYVL